jgi:hypothetical protein
MATWQEVQHFIKSNYKIVSDDGSLIMMDFSSDDGRSQLVGISNPGGEWMRFMSIVGEKSDINVERLFEESKVFGVTTTDNVYMLVHNQLLETVDSAEINKALSLLTMAADRVEKAVTNGGDAF